MTWLIVCRAIQGIGGGGIIQLVNITISDIVPLQQCVLVHVSGTCPHLNEHENTGAASMEV
jgi:MFS family permease